MAVFSWESGWFIQQPTAPALTGQYVVMATRQLESVLLPHPRKSIDSDSGRAGEAGAFMDSILAHRHAMYTEA